MVFALPLGGMFANIVLILLSFVHFSKDRLLPWKRVNKIHSRLTKVLLTDILI